MKGNLPAYEDGTECSETSAYKNSGAGELPKRKHAKFSTRRKFEISNHYFLYTLFKNMNHSVNVGRTEGLNVYVEIKRQLDATEVFYCRSYCLLNMFRAPLCPSSGAQEYYTVVAACGISCCGFQVAGLVWS